MNAVIRRATEADVPAAVRMGLAFREAFAPHLRENPTQMATIARWLLDEPHALLVADTGTVGDPADVVGMLGLALVTHPLSGDLYASELFWWVDRWTPGSLGLRLLDAGERWAKEHGALAMHMVALASNPTVGKLYDRRGYVPRDSTWERTL